MVKMVKVVKAVIVPPINDDEEEPEDTPGAGYTNSVSAVLFIMGAAMLTILG
jgi:hypothetical protein